MTGPIIWIQGDTPNLIHRFEGATDRSPVVVITPDAAEAADLAAAVTERQRQRLAETGTVFGERLDARRPRWRR